MGYRYRQIRVYFLTLFISATGLFIAVNMMVLSLDPDNSTESLEFRKFRYDRDELRKNQFSHEINVLHDLNVAKGQRKPKTTNNDNNDNMVQNEEYENVHEMLIPNNNEDNVHNVDNMPGYVGDNDDTNSKQKENGDIIDNTKDYMNDEDDDDYDDDDDEEEEDEDEEDEELDKDESQEMQNNDPASIDNPNKPFKPGDFGDIAGFEYQQNPNLQFKEVGINTGVTGTAGKVTISDLKKFSKLKKKLIAKLDEIKATTKNILKTESVVVPELNQETIVQDLVYDGIYWSSYVESLIPKGLTFSNVTKLVRTLRNTVVKKLQKPMWDRCGRPKNGYLVLENGQEMCARYRETRTVYVYGEVLSFYLSRLLGMDNVPVVVLSTSNSSQWKSVNVRNLEWQDNIPIALMEWIPDLDSRSSRVYIPPLILHAYRTGEPVTKKDVDKLRLLPDGTTQLSALIQWGTMIVFDYITGNYDRVASMQDGAADQKKESVIEEQIRNLRQTSNTKKLWLFDNESGLLDGYSTLDPNSRHSKFTGYHNRMLHTMCIFQKSLVRELQKLSEHPSPHLRLMHFAESYEPLLQGLDRKQKYFKMFESMFKVRLQEVSEWIKHCDSLNS